MKIGFELAFKTEGYNMCYLNDSYVAIKHLFDTLLDYGTKRTSYHLTRNMNDQLEAVYHKNGYEDYKAYRKAEESLFNLGHLVCNKCYPYDTMEEALEHELEQNSFYGHIERYEEKGFVNVTHYCISFDMRKKLDIMLFNIIIENASPTIVIFN